jgi:hypothetical protein
LSLDLLWRKPTLPNSDYPPTQSAQGLLVAAISVHVSKYLGSPEANPGCREARSLAARVVVPKTTIDENCGTAIRNDDVGLAGQGPHMQAKAETLFG